MKQIEEKVFFNEIENDWLAVWVREKRFVVISQPVICGCHERTVTSCIFNVPLFSIYTHSESELHFLPALTILLSFIPFCCFFLIRFADSIDSAVSYGRHWGKGKQRRKRKINHISFYYSSNGKKNWLEVIFFLFLLFLTAEINLFDHTNCVMITKHYHHRMLMDRKKEKCIFIRLKRRLNS